MKAASPIGVFDSGIGGLSVLQALRRTMPREDFVYFSDAAHAPYGERGDAFVVERSRAVARRLLDEHGIKALVVACNTATAAAAHALRTEHARLAIVGVEPALKPAAALTRTGRVAVFATRVTLSSAKFRALHGAMPEHVDFVLQPCDGLAGAIERDDQAQVRELCRRYVRAAGQFGGAPGRIDTLVLGCTHYVFARRELGDLLGPDVRIVDTGEAVALQTRRLLASRGILDAAGRARMHFVGSGCEPQLLARGAWLRLQA